VLIVWLMDCDRVFERNAVTDRDLVIDEVCLEDGVNDADPATLKETVRVTTGELVSDVVPDRVGDRVFETVSDTARLTLIVLLKVIEGVVVNIAELETVCVELKLPDVPEVAVLDLVHVLDLSSVCVKLPLRDTVVVLDCVPDRCGESVAELEFDIVSVLVRFVERDAVDVSVCVTEVVLVASMVAVSVVDMVCELDVVDERPGLSVFDEDSSGDVVIVLVRSGEAEAVAVFVKLTSRVVECVLLTVWDRVGDSVRVEITVGEEVIVLEKDKLGVVVCERDWLMLRGTVTSLVGVRVIVKIRETVGLVLSTVYDADVEYDNVCSIVRDGECVTTGVSVAVTVRECVLLKVVDAEAVDGLVAERDTVFDVDTDNTRVAVAELDHVKVIDCVRLCETVPDALEDSVIVVVSCSVGLGLGLGLRDSSCVWLCVCVPDSLFVIDRRFV